MTMEGKVHAIERNHIAAVAIQRTSWANDVGELVTQSCEGPMVIPAHIVGGCQGVDVRANSA